MEGTDRYCNIPNILTVGLMVSGKKLLLKFIFHYKSMKTLDPRGWANFYSRDLSGIIYIKDH